MEPGVAEGVVETSKGEALSARWWVNVVDGVVRTEAPESCRPVRGGLLCDEPGLGKTITVLALLLRTRGILPGECRESPERTGQDNCRAKCCYKAWMYRWYCNAETCAYDLKVVFAHGENLKRFACHVTLCYCNSYSRITWLLQKEGLVSYLRGGKGEFYH